MRKIFEASVETMRIVESLRNMRLGQKLTFGELSKSVGFPVSSTTPAYHRARRIAERDHGVYIGSLRGVGFFRGTGDDMVDSLDQLAARMRKSAKRSVERADLAIINNLSEEKYERAVERRNRASIIFSTTASPMPTSNRKRALPAEEARPSDNFGSLRTVK